MLILFSSLGAHGHLFPLLPLAEAAVRAGHRVKFATTGGFHDVLSGIGVEPVITGAGMRDVASDLLPPGRSPRDMGDAEGTAIIARLFGDLLARAFATGVAGIIERERPDLVVQELANPGAGIAARAAGVPVLCHGFGRMTTGSEMPKQMIGHLRGVAAEHGVDLGEVDLGGGDDSVFLLGNPYLDICPPSLRDPSFTIPRTIPLRPVPFATPGELPAIATAPRDKPLVYLTLGTAFGHPEVFRAAIDGLASLDAHVLVAAGPTVAAAEIGEVPDNVSLHAWVPQADLLPHVDLVVHHGGSGTTMGALGAGVPQLVLPQGADQFTNAEAVASAGLGERLLGDAVVAEAVASAARGLLASEEVAVAAKAVAAEIAAMPSPDEVAARLPELI
ncbi:MULTISPECIES: glycosyltransferase [Actinosynnema]|uniref:glycosyltransferase n=1 Tax=Actinosynnema TaxID=40566 RepID=UPI0020A56E2C|nr:glycosyltransferase [Actinosynnema pretiosum]MCP2099472.1 glycosyltransferase, MGT family [Actinosynnema pretiosum]